MCIAGIARVAEVWDEEGVRLGRLDDGSIVPLTYIPEAAPGATVLVHLGIPVEVVDVRVAQDVLKLRQEADER